MKVRDKCFFCDSTLKTTLNNSHNDRFEDLMLECIDCFHYEADIWKDTKSGEIIYSREWFGKKKASVEIRCTRLEAPNSKRTSFSIHKKISALTEEEGSLTFPFILEDEKLKDLMENYNKILSLIHLK